MKNRKSRVPVIVMLMLVMTTVAASAAIDPAAFSPRTGKYVYLIKNNTAKFENDHEGYLTEAVGTGSGAALIPEDKDFRYMIKNVYGDDYEESKAYTECLGGVLADDSYIDALGTQGAATLPADSGTKTNRTHFWWFKMSTERGNALSGYEAPEVKWTGLYIYDPDKGGYQKIDLYMKVVCHSMAGSFTNRIPGLFSVSKGVRGLPSIRIYHIRAVQLNFKAYKAGTNEYYPIRTCITFGDVDGHQSVSSLAASTSGVAAKRTANILFGPYGTGEKWWVATGNTSENIADESAEADNYKIAYNIDAQKSGGAGFDLAFTPGQQSDGEPSGNFARFSASTYENPDRSPDPPVIREPVKYVTDSDSSNDSDKGKISINGIDSPALTHNTISDRDEEITYTVVQKIPLYMYSNIASSDLSELTFSDKIDDCMDYVNGSLRVYSVKDSAEVDVEVIRDPTSVSGYGLADVTSKFEIGSTGKTISASWKASCSAADRDSVLYGGGDGAVLKFVFKAKLQAGKSLGDMKNHQGADGKAHLSGSRDAVDIPNQATVTYKMRSGESAALGSVNARYDEGQSDADKEKNSFVYTRYEIPPVKVKIQKVDKDTNEPLTGAELSIYEGDLSSSEPAGDPVASWTTDGTDHVETGTLKAGTVYTLVEEEAPDGYEKAEKVVFTPEEENMVTIAMEDPVKRTDIRISKNVTGSLGDITKKFEFLLQINNAEPEHEYIVEGGGSSSVSSDEEGRIQLDFQLKDNESLVIKDVPVKCSGESVTYSVTEDASNHVASFKTDSGKTGENSTSEKALSTGNLSLEKDSEVSFTNSRDIAPTTGAGTNERIYILIAVMLLEVMLYIIIRKKAGRRG